MSLSIVVLLAGCATLSWHGVQQERTVVRSEGKETRKTEKCAAICSQINPNGQCGRWVEPVGEACRKNIEDKK